MSAHLLLMGEPRLVGNDGRLVRIPSKAFGLAAALVLARSTPVSRSGMAELLWGPSERRHGNLRKLLWTTRSVTRRAGFDLFRSDHLTLSLSEETVAVDVLDLIGLIHDTAASNLSELCDVYRGDLLESLPFDSLEFGEWIGVQRAKLRDAFLNAIAPKLDADRDPRGTARQKAAARRVLEIDPYSEVACRMLLQIHAQEGETAQLRQTFQDLVHRLADDLSAAPAPETTKLFRDLIAAETQVSTTLPSALATSEPAKTRWPDPTGSGRHPSGTPSLAVLGLRQAPASDAANLAHNLLDDLTTALSRCKSLRVLAAEVSAPAPGNPAQVARLVDYAVESRVADWGNTACLTLRLVEMSSRRIIWADRLDIRPGEAPSWPAERIGSLFASIVDRIEGSERAEAASGRHLTAFHWFMVGQDCLKTLELPSLRRGRRALRASRECDPTFTPTLAALARSHVLEWLLLARNDSESLAESVSLASQAVRIDPDDSAGHRAMAFALLYQKANAASLDAFAKADRLNPHCPDLIIEHASAHMHCGDLGPARALITKAYALNPAPPDFYHWVSASTFFIGGAPAKAIEVAAAVQVPSVVYRLLACCHARCGDLALARQYMAKVMEVHPDFAIDNWLKLLPTQNPHHVQYYAESLRLAGFR